MTAVEVAFAAGWAAFWLYWIAVAVISRGAAGPRSISWSRELRIRAVIVVAVILLVRLGVFRHHTMSVSTDPWRWGVGLGIFALGLAFAIWARRCIGRNWGTPMTRRVNPELVTSGPYRFVRHPIYSGILAAGIGTAVGLSWLWFVAVALAGIYFVYSATVEERYMTQQFPEAYPAYRLTSKMLVPFLF